MFFSFFSFFLCTITKMCPLFLTIAMWNLRFISLGVLWGCFPLFRPTSVSVYSLCQKDSPTTGGLFNVHVCLCTKKHRWTTTVCTTGEKKHGKRSDESINGYQKCETFSFSALITVKPFYNISLGFSVKFTTIGNASFHLVLADSNGLRCRL